MDKKKKQFLSVVYLISLLPMLLPQYGGARGVQEIQGMINLMNPIGMISVVLFYVGIWAPIPGKYAKKIVGLMGCVGVVVSEIYEFLTWHIMTITGAFSIEASFQLVYPEFYVGLGASVMMILVYLRFGFLDRAENGSAKS